MLATDNCLCILLDSSVARTVGVVGGSESDKACVVLSLKLGVISNYCCRLNKSIDDCLVKSKLVCKSIGLFVLVSEVLDVVVVVICCIVLFRNNYAFLYEVLSEIVVLLKSLLEDRIDCVSCFAAFNLNTCKSNNVLNIYAINCVAIFLNALDDDLEVSSLTCELSCAVAFGELNLDRLIVFVVVSSHCVLNCDLCVLVIYAVSSCSEAGSSVGDNVLAVCLSCRDCFVSFGLSIVCSTNDVVVEALTVDSIDCFLTKSKVNKSRCLCLNGALSLNVAILVSCDGVTCVGNESDHIGCYFIFASGCLHLGVLTNGSTVKSKRETGNEGIATDRKAVSLHCGVGRTDKVAHTVHVVALAFFIYSVTSVVKINYVTNSDKSVSIVGSVLAGAIVLLTSNESEDTSLDINFSDGAILRRNCKICVIAKSDILFEIFFHVIELSVVLLGKINTEQNCRNYYCNEDYCSANKSNDVKRREFLKYIIFAHNNSPYQF